MAWHMCEGFWTRPFDLGRHSSNLCHTFCWKPIWMTWKKEACSILSWLLLMSLSSLALEPNSSRFWHIKISAETFEFLNGTSNVSWTFHCYIAIIELAEPQPVVYSNKLLYICVCLYMCVYLFYSSFPLRKPEKYMYITSYIYLRRTFRKLCCVNYETHKNNYYIISLMSESAKADLLERVSRKVIIVTGRDEGSGERFMKGHKLTVMSQFWRPNTQQGDFR